MEISLCGTEARTKKWTRKWTDGHSNDKILIWLLYCSIHTSCSKSKYRQLVFTVIIKIYYVLYVGIMTVTIKNVEVILIIFIVLLTVIHIISMFIYAKHIILLQAQEVIYVLILNIFYKKSISVRKCEVKKVPTPDYIA